MDRKKRLDKFILTSAKAETYKKEYEALKKEQDEKEALKKKKAELKEYKAKLINLKYGFIKKYWKVILIIIIIIILLRISASLSSYLFSL